MIEIIVYAIYYEAIIAIFGFFLVFAVARKFYQKNSQITKLLLWIFLFFNLAVVGSCIGKILYVYVTFGQEPTGPFSALIILIENFRISFVCVVIALYLSFLLKSEVFEKALNTKLNLVYIVIGVIVGLISIIVYQWDYWLYDVFAFLAVLIYMILVYYPFMRSFVHLYRRVDYPKFKRALLSLAFMAICFVMVFICFLGDQLITMFTGMEYSVFYYLAWLFTIVGYLIGIFRLYRSESKP